jgi:hypothetical protein
VVRRSVCSGESFKAIAVETEILGHSLPTELVAVLLSAPVLTTEALGVALKSPTQVRRREVEILEAFARMCVCGVE